MFAMKLVREALRLTGLEDSRVRDGAGGRLRR